MKTKDSPSKSKPHGRSVKSLANDVVFPVEVERRALGWVLWWLRLRKGWSADTEAKHAQVGVQTVRDVEKGECQDFGWTTAKRLCRALRRSLSHTERLAERYLRRGYHRQKAAHHGKKQWKMVYPWRQNRRPPFKKHGITC